MQFLHAKTNFFLALVCLVAACMESLHFCAHSFSVNQIISSFTEDSNGCESQNGSGTQGSPIESESSDRDCSIVCSQHNAIIAYRVLVSAELNFVLAFPFLSQHIISKDRPQPQTPPPLV